MQIASSAKRTWRLLRSASEYTATVRMPSSRQAEITRSAISPRFAIRTFLNMPTSLPRPYREQRLTVFHGLPVLSEDLHHFTGNVALDLVHELHGFHDAHPLANGDGVTHLHERS